MKKFTKIFAHIIDKEAKDFAFSRFIIIFAPIL